jgi:hypothetical protein
VVRAEDGDGEVDRRIDHRPGGAVGVADRVDGGGASAEDVALRSKILTFYVDKAPVLLVRDPSFKPTPNFLFTSRSLSPITLPAIDVDPLDPYAPNNKVGGTPATGLILRRKIAVLGKWAGDPTRDTCYVEPTEFPSSAVGSINLPLGLIANGNITLRIRLCDCAQCDDLRWPSQCPFSLAEASPGQGRCVDTNIPARLSVPEPATIIGNNGTTQRPGSPPDPGRRQP